MSDFLKKLRKKIVFWGIVFLSMILIPILSVCKSDEKSALAFGLNTQLEKSGNTLEKKEKDGEYFKILDESSGEILKVPDKEFLIGVVASEMPAAFEEEALKAQAVASYTYFCRARNKNIGKKDYDFTVNTKKQENYIKKEQMENKWGSNFEKYYGKIANVVESVFGEVIEDDGEPVLAVYHAMSSGKTEKSADVFGGDLKYLQSVESPGDKLVPGYESLVEVSLENFKANLSKINKDCNFESNPDSWVKNITRTDAGMVKIINICGADFKGSEIRKAFCLRSSNFDINYDGNSDKFIFNVRGYGHGVGMSQQGAQYMAKNGNTYKQILTWYYPGTEIVKVK